MQNSKSLNPRRSLYKAGFSWVLYLVIQQELCKLYIFFLIKVKFAFQRSIYFVLWFARLSLTYYGCSDWLFNQCGLNVIKVKWPQVVLMFHRSSEYGLTLPSLLVFKRNDPYQPINVFDAKFTIQSIVEFVLRSNLPSFVSILRLTQRSFLWSSGFFLMHWSQWHKIIETKDMKQYWTKIQRFANNGLIKCSLLSPVRREVRSRSSSH